MDRQETAKLLDGLVSEISQQSDASDADSIRAWLMAATLRVWAGNRLCAEDYLKVLPAFADREFTIAQVITALDCAGDPARMMEIPPFFRAAAERDAREGTSESRSLADVIGRFLAELALVNGDFTLAEASALHEIVRMLLAYCDRQGVPSGKKPEHHPEMITSLSQTGYYQNMEAGESGDAGNEAPREAAGSKPDSGGSRLVPPAVTPVIDPEPELPPAPQTPAGITVRNPETEAEAGETLESVLAELNGLVGLDRVKSDVQSLLNFIRVCQIRTSRGMKVPTMSYHLVFTGNPGTGKTTVARLVAKLYYLMGILPQGQMVETDRSGLVAGYLGQTAIKTQEVIQSALGGVLFIDEAYSLVNDKDDSYGKEAIETILKAMEDHRNELVVIVAGYDNLMHQFIDANPGLRSRFNKYFHFPDYSGEELLLILRRFCDTNGYRLAEDAVLPLQTRLNEMYENREEHFGNARAIRNLFENAISRQANRLVLDGELSDAELAELTLADLMPESEV